MTAQAVNNRGSRLTLILLALLFSGPLLLSWGWFYFVDTSHRSGAASHGDLVIPPRHLPNIGLLDPAQVINGAELHGKWTLFYISRETCDEVCADNLYRMRQIRLAMGKNAYRVQRALVAGSSPLPEPVLARLRDYPGQLVLHDDARAGFIDKFRMSRSDDPVSAARLYIVDPLGNLMMSYPPERDPIGIIKDLKRMLKISRIG